ncbi:Choline dehydrogenase mitochondrial [Fasciola gigantica]|uniref:Choline dehydrogenase mitochondrial n=1 Tax=Fasciola gigantica TaxID=46835 RepID=A0A504YCZ0_FASGI|nr:Choline dehydrogenase mitochondrial [Fasciola gigantica]
MTVKDGKRWSTSDAYLHPALKMRSNLSVTTGALVTRVLFDRTRAVAVEYLKDGQLCEAHAQREIILSGGAINSPQTLMLSGIGDADHLRSVGIDAWHHLPGVGQNLQDHLEPVTLYKAQWKFPHVMIGIGLKWILFRQGWGATSHLETGGFARSEASVPHPNIQFHFLPSTIHDHGRKMGSQHAFQVHVGPMRPLSKGQILLASSDPSKAPLIDANYMANEHDRAEMRACIRLSREIFAQPAFAKEYAGVELSPGPEKTSDRDLDAFVRALGDSAYHPSCTCRMGQNPNGRIITEEERKTSGHVGNARVDAAVTKPDCKVWGLDGLRIVDASIMPSVVSGNLNAPIIMMAERASDLILSEHLGRSVMLSPSKVKVWKPKHPEKQRDGEPIVKLSV